MTRKLGHILVLSGPSGVGKSSVAERLLGDPLFGRAVTATTRAPRPGETDGVAYHFLSEASFRERVGRGEFLEHATVHGRLYGTPLASVRDVTSGGRVCLLVIDVQGAATLRERRDRGLLPFDADFVFLLPPGEEALFARLRHRGTEESAEMRDRLLTGVRDELPRAREFDHRVVNDDLARAAAEIRLIVSARRARPPA